MTRQGDGYRSPSTQIAWRIAFSTVNRLKLYALPGAQPSPTRNNPSHIHQGGAGSDQGESDQQQVAAA